ncbi:Protein GVP36, partial [Zancudomyces culisetae]
MFNFTNRHLPNDLLDPHRRKAAEEITMDYEGKKESTTLGKLSKNCITSAETLGRDGPIGSGLSKFGKLQADINDSYIKMVTEIQINVLPLLRDENADAVEAAIKSCKDVKSARLSLDSLKRSLSGAKPEKVARIQQSIETAEDDFVSKVGDSMDKMKKTLDSAQQEFYQKASQLVQSTEKELEEIKVTQETLAG